jgi:hypothetical protein
MIGSINNNMIESKMIKNWIVIEIDKMNNIQIITTNTMMIDNIKNIIESKKKKN